LKQIKSSTDSKEKHRLLWKYYILTSWSQAPIEKQLADLQDIDIDSLQILNKQYWKDKNNVYYIWYMGYGEIFDHEQALFHRVQDADVPTFSTQTNEKTLAHSGITYDGQLWFEWTQIVVSYAIDKQFVFVNWQKVHHSDAKTYTVLPFWVFAKDKNFVYFRNWYQWYAPHIPLYDVDPKTFEIIDWHFAKDKNYVYHITNCGGGSGRETCIDRISDKPDSFDPTTRKESCPLDAPDCDQSEEESLICDPRLFQQPDGTIDIHNWYYKDPKQKILYYWTINIDADYESFQTITNLDKDWYGSFYPWFAKDKNHVFYYVRILSWANPSTFKVSHWYIVQDDKNVWYISWCGTARAISWANVPSFWAFSWEETYAYPDYHKDTTSVYRHWLPIPWANPNSFQRLRYWYAQDGNTLYYQNKKVVNADTSTVIVVWGIWWFDAYDGNSWFKNWEMIGEKK